MPNPAYVGTDSFIYQLQSRLVRGGALDSATVTIDITGTTDTSTTTTTTMTTTVPGSTKSSVETTEPGLHDDRSVDDEP